jgi:serine/threonine protein kinase
MIAFLCSGCGKSLKVKDELAGRKGRCPHCQQPMTVPSSADAAACTANISETDAKTILPASLGADRDSKTILPSVPRGNSGLKKGNTAVPSVAAPKANAELYDFLAPAQAADEIGRLGSYRVLKVLGAGGMGVVFQAEDPKLNRLVALKAMLPALAASGTNKERFLLEARAAAAIEHDHIVAIFQVDEDRGVPFIAMPFLRGEALEDRLKRERKLPTEEVLRIARETADGLAAAHERNMIHRDIKPANIWLEGEKGRVKILDFGLARSAGGTSQLTQQGAIIGTPAYMAPEQGAGKQVDTRCDLFSLGCVMYRMATGTLPFKGADTVSTLVAVATETPKAPRKLNPELPPRLSKLIMDLLAKAPKDRPPSALSVVDLLDEIAREPAADVTEAVEVIDESPARVRKQEYDTLPVVSDDHEHDERPAQRSLMMPLLIGGGVGAFALVLIGVIAFLALRGNKTDTARVAENRPADNSAVNTQRPVNANVNSGGNDPVRNPSTAGNDPVRNPTVGGNDPVRKPSDDPVGGSQPKSTPKTEGPREPTKTFKPYTSAVKGLMFAPDGKHFFAFGERSNRVDSWQVDSQKIVQSYDLSVPVQACLLSSDGARLIAFNEGRLRAWDVDGGQALAEVIAPAGMRIVGGGFTADKDIRAALCLKGPLGSTIRIWDNATKKFLVVNPTVRKPIPMSIDHAGTEVQQAFFGPACKRLITWSQDRIFRVFDLEAKKPVSSFPVAPNTEKAIAVSGDFSRVMGTFHQANVHVYDVDTGSELKDIVPQKFGDTDAVAFGADSNLGVAGGFTGVVRVLDLDSGDVKKELKGGSIVTSVALSPDGKTVLAGDFTGSLALHKLEE